MKNVFGIPLAILCGGLIIAGAVFFSLRKPNQPDEGIHAALIRPVSTSDHIFGNPAAPVIIVVYSDFECTFCKTFHETLRQIIASEGLRGDIAWVFREFPLTEVHPHALSLARAAECAAEASGNDGFWRFSNELFSHQPVASTEYGTIAALSNITANEFASCFMQEPAAIDARIMADRENALEMGAQGTPFSVILKNGAVAAVMDGGYSYDAVKQLVDQALAH